MSFHVVWVSPKIRRDPQSGMQQQPHGKTWSMVGRTRMWHYSVFHICSNPPMKVKCIVAPGPPCVSKYSSVSTLSFPDVSANPMKRSLVCLEGLDPLGFETQDYGVPNRMTHMGSLDQRKASHLQGPLTHSVRLASRGGVAPRAFASRSTSCVERAAPATKSASSSLCAFVARQSEAESPNDRPRDALWNCWARGEARRGWQVGISRKMRDPPFRARQEWKAQTSGGRYTDPYPAISGTQTDESR